MKMIGRLCRILLVIGSVGMMLWYTASKIIGIGSIVGFLLFGIIGACAALWGHISCFLKKLRQKKAWRILTNIAAVLCGLLTVYVIAVLCIMGVYAAKKPADDATLVVLGCQVNGDRPSLMLSRRIDAAYAYLQEHPQAMCIVSGGKGNHENISEAQCMYEQLTARGIDGSRIYREERSVNTDQNIAFSGAIIEQEHLPRELAIVTDGFHEWRAARIARRYGYTCGAVPADTPFHLAANFTTREVLAITAELLHG